LSRDDFLSPATGLEERMPESSRAALMVLLTVCTSAALPPFVLAKPGEAVLEYPVRMLDVHNTNGSCWRGMDAAGNWRGLGSEPAALVVPQDWLVGPPPSGLSAVTIPEDHWVNLAFSGPIADGKGTDILVIEWGTMGEQALVFLTDGADREYVVTLAEAEWTNRQEVSLIEIDLSNHPAPFVARGIRIVGTDFGGGSPGFDLASIQARVSHECASEALYPNPPSGAPGVEPDVRLSWTPACTTGAQRIYFSAVESQVRSAAADALAAVRPSDTNSFQPQVELAKTYYWRVDAAVPTDANLSYPGDVWSFTTVDHLVVDGFETYADNGSLQDSWNCPGRSSVSLGAANSQTCDRFMNFEYYYDEASWPYAFRQFNPSQDWTRSSPKVLQLLLRGGLPDPTVANLFVGLTDGAHEQTVYYAGQTDVDPDANWYTWRIPLDDFDGVDLTHVRGMAIGIRPKSIQADQSYSGAIHITDISLYPALCLKGRRPTADLNGDCAVDYRDVEQMAADWLRGRIRSYAVAEPNEPVLWYTFDGHAKDSAGTAHGEVQGRTTYGPGAYGQAIRFSYQGDVVAIPDAARVFAGIREAITIAFWQYGEDSSHLNDTICCSNYEYGKSDPAISINLGCWQNPGQYRWDCGYPWSIDNRLAGRHRDKREWTGRWNHWVFTKDIRGGPSGQEGRMAIYLNGELYDSRIGTDSPITNITSFEIGSGWYGRYDGLIDDFRIYDYALSPAEVVWLTTNSTGTVEDPTSSPADLDATNRVDLRDFAILATQWLEDTLWP
jgi:hypothetical protein